MYLFKLLNNHILEKINKFSEFYHMSITTFCIININSRSFDEQFFYLTDTLILIETLSGKMPIIKKIFFKKNSSNLKCIIESTNISKLFFLTLFTYINMYKFASFIFTSFFLNFKSIKLKNSVLMKLQNATILSHFYGNTEHFNKNNLQFDVYISLKFKQQTEVNAYDNFVNNL